MERCRVGCRVENHRDRTRGAQVSEVLVDTGSKLNWIPAEVLRSIGVEKEAKRARFRTHIGLDGRMPT